MIAAPVRALLWLALAQIPPGHRGVVPSGGWEPVSPPYTDVGAIAVASDGSESVYAAASDPTSGKSGVFRSDDFGTSWTMLADALPGEKAVAVAVDPRDAARLYAATQNTDVGYTRLYASSDGGSTWRFAILLPLSCGGAFAFDDQGPYFNTRCSDQVFASEDDGLTWSVRDGLLESLVANPAGALYGLHFDLASGALSRSDDGGRTWDPIRHPDCYEPLMIHAIAEDARGRLLVGTGRFHGFFDDCPGFGRTADAGGTWVFFLGGVVLGLAPDPGEPARLVAWTEPTIFPGSGGVFETEDDGVTWRNLDLLETPRAMAFAASGRVLFAATDSGLLRLYRRSPTVVPR